MDIGDIEGNESERHECDTHDPSIEDDNENEITEGKHLCHHLVEDDKYREKWGYECHKESKVSYDFEREEWKWRQAMDRETEKHGIIVRRCAVFPCPRIKDKRDTWESEPIDESSVNPIFLWEPEVCVDNFPIDESVICSSRLEFEFWDFVEYAIENLRREFFEGTNPCYIRATIVDNLVSCFPFFEEFWYAFHRMLPICIECDDRISGCMLQTRCYRELFPEVTGEIYADHTRFSLAYLLDLLPGAIRTPIIDEEYLKLVFLLQCIKH